MIVLVRRAVLFFVIAALMMFAAQAAAQSPQSSQPVAPNAPPPGNQPKIELLNPVYDFGTVLDGQPVSHTFKIRNAGQGDLIINRVQTSCGCTAAEPSSKRLKSGEEADVAVTFDTRHQKGHRVRTITVFTNDPQMANGAMTLQGEVKVEVEASPSEISFDKVRFGVEQTRQFAVNNLASGGELKLGPVTNSSPHIKVAHESSPDGKRGANFKVTLLKTMPIGPFDDTIDITTNRQPIQVHVFGQVVGDLNVDPAQVSFGIVPHGQGVVRIVRFTNSGAKVVKVIGVSSSNQSVAAKVDPVAEGKEYKITVQLRKGTPDGQLRGMLKINTDLPEQPELTVPYYAIVGQFEG